MLFPMRSERGASAVEYALMLGVVAVVIVLAVSFLGRTASSTFRCVGAASGGGTCVEGVQFVAPVPSHTCKSQNGEHGQGCFGK